MLKRFFHLRKCNIVGLNYYTPENYSNQKDIGKVSRYAWGKDYHLIIWQKLDELETVLKELEPELETLSYVDTGPVMDKACCSCRNWLDGKTYKCYQS